MVPAGCMSPGLSLQVQDKQYKRLLIEPHPSGPLKAPLPPWMRQQRLGEGRGQGQALPRGQAWEMPGTVNSGSHPLNPSGRTSSWPGTWKPVGQLAPKVPFSPLPTAQVTPIHALAPPLFSTEPGFPHPPTSALPLSFHPTPLPHLSLSPSLSSVSSSEKWDWPGGPEQVQAQRGTPRGQGRGRRIQPPWAQRRAHGRRPVSACLKED